MSIPIIGGIIEGVSDFFNTRQKIKAAQKERKDVLKEKKLDADILKINQATEADITMDVDSRKNSGWMDDVSFGIFLLPAILAFFPPALPHVSEGFKALELMPIWYQYALGMMLVAVWGYRRLVTPIVEIVVKAWVKKLGG